MTDFIAFVLFFALIGFALACGAALFAYWPVILGLVLGIMAFRVMSQYE